MAQREQHKIRALTAQLMELEGVRDEIENDLMPAPKIISTTQTIRISL